MRPLREMIGDWPAMSEGTESKFHHKDKKSTKV
jgi:hypothetical protein